MRVQGVRADVGMDVLEFARDAHDECMHAQTLCNARTHVTVQEALRELDKDKPHLIVHQHHCSAGFGAYLLSQLEALNRSLVARTRVRPFSPPPPPPHTLPVHALGSQSPHTAANAQY